MSLPNYDAFAAELSADHGLSINQHGRVYRKGTALPFETEVSIAIEYLRAQAEEAAGGKRVSINQLAKKCQVSPATFTKVKEKLVSHGHVPAPQEVRSNRDLPTGPGAQTLNELDIFVILMLYHQEPSRCLNGYVCRLYELTGTFVSKSTISRFFLQGFDIKGSLCKPNLITYNKFCRHNLERGIE